MLGVFTGSMRCDRSKTVRTAVFPIGLDHGECPVCMFVVCSVSVVFGRGKLTSVSSSATKDCTAFSTASLAAVIKVSSSVIIAMSATVFLASVFASSMYRICVPSVAASLFR